MTNRVSIFNARVLFVAALGGTTVLAGCGGDDEAQCSDDFDCPVGQVCKSGDPATCADAGAGEERTFGRVNLQFATGDEVYLVGVVSLPDAGSAAAPADSTLYSLSGGTAASGLRLARQTRSIDTSTRWQGRVAWASRRHQATRRIASRYRKAPSRALSLGRNAPCPSACGTSEFCWSGTCGTTGTLAFVDSSSMNVTLAGVVSDAGNLAQLNVLVDDASAAQSAAALSIAQKFASTIGQQFLLLGQANHGTPLDRDGDGRLNLVFTNRVASGVDLDVVGFFNPNDFTTEGMSGSTGNESDILWVRIPGPGATNQGGLITEELSVGTLAHEYTHLASFGRRVQGQPASPSPEVLWLDEALAHLMEDLTGWGTSNIPAVAVGLFEWNNTQFAGPNDSVEQRGMGYTLLRHFIDDAARGLGATGAADATTQTTATGLITALLDSPQTGFLHQPFQTTTPQGFWRWARAVYVSGNDDVLTAAQTDAFLTVGTATTGNMMGFNPYGDYVDARQSDVVLEGPATEDLDDLTEALDGEVPTSGTTLYLATGFSGMQTVEGTADASANIHLFATQVQ